MSVALSDQDKSILRTAAYGAVSLMVATGSPRRAATNGSVVALTSATGLVGHVLAAKAAKDVDLKGKTVAELADQVLPALTAAMNLLTEQDPAEANNFRGTILLALEAAQTQQSNPNLTMAEMARKITAALDAAGMATADGRAVAGPDRPELRKVIEEIVDSGFVGVSLRVHDERGEWVSSAGVAERGGTAKPPVDGHVRIGSNTKTFIATLVLQLVAEGKVGLDASVNGYLPEFGLDERITVRMLLQHTSGVFNFSGEVYDDGTVVLGIPIPYSGTGTEWVDNRFHTYRPEELARLSLSKPLRFAPGTKWSYSNTNYVPARLLIEKVTGHSSVEETQRRILRPLRLSGTVLPGTRTDIPGSHAHAYYRYSDAGQEKTVDITRQNPSWISGGGDMISTTQDLQKFISALMRGRLLPAPLLAQMRTPDPTAGYGLGLFVQDGTTPTPFPPPSCGVTVLTHNGSVQGYATLMYSTPDGSKTLTASLNYVDDVAGSLVGPFMTELQKLVDVVFCDGQPAA
jgi:D-alanyl-D-alanine carboxypeptidase